MDVGVVVDVDVLVEVAVFVDVAVAVEVGVGVDVAVLVAEGVPVFVAVDVTEGVTVAVLVGLGMFDGVTVTVLLAVGVAERTGMDVRVGVREGVLVGGVGVLVKVPGCKTTRVYVGNSVRVGVIVIPLAMEFRVGNGLIVGATSVGNDADVSREIKLKKMKIARHKIAV